MKHASSTRRTPLVFLLVLGTLIGCAAEKGTKVNIGPGNINDGLDQKPLPSAGADDLKFRALESLMRARAASQRLVTPPAMNRREQDGCLLINSFRMPAWDFVVEYKCLWNAATSQGEFKNELTGQLTFRKFLSGDQSLKGQANGDLRLRLTRKGQSQPVSVSTLRRVLTVNLPSSGVDPRTYSYGFESADVIGLPSQTKNDYVSAQAKGMWYLPTDESKPMLIQLERGATLTYIYRPAGSSRSTELVLETGWDHGDQVKFDTSTACPRPVGKFSWTLREDASTQERTGEIATDKDGILELTIPNSKKLSWPTEDCGLSDG